MGHRGRAALASVLAAGFFAGTAAQTVWTPQTSGTTNTLYSATWTGGLWAVSGVSGTLLTSPGGSAWTSRNAGSSAWLYSGAWSGSLLVVSAGAPASVRTSPDGLAWTTRSTGSAGTDDLRAVVWTGTQFIAAGGGPSNAPSIILTSPNGSDWTPRSPGTTQYLSAAVWTGAQAVITGYGGRVLTSPDGTAWTQRTSGTTEILNSVAWTGAQLVAVGSAGVIRTSPDGITWTARTSGATEWLRSVIWTGTQLVAVGENGVVLKSLDGITWFKGATGATGVLYGVRWSGGQFVAVGANGAILTARADSIPVAPVPGAPAQNASGVALSGALTWTPPVGAMFYRVQIAGDSLFSTLVLDDSVVTATTRNAAGLSAGTRYFWRVNARNAAGTGAWSETRAFTTAIPPPPVPVLLLPAASATGVPREGALLAWSRSPGATSYHVQLSANSGFSTTLVNDSALTDTTRAISQALTGGSLYYWRVRARNADGASAYSAANGFTSAPVSLLPQGVTLRALASGNGASLRFSIPRGGRVVIRLLDIRGRETARLVDAAREAGTHVVPLPAGSPDALRLLDFRAGEFHETLKILP